MEQRHELKSLANVYEETARHLAAGDGLGRFVFKSAIMRLQYELEVLDELIATYGPLNPTADEWLQLMADARRAWCEAYPWPPTTPQPVKGGGE